MTVRTIAERAKGQHLTKEIRAKARKDSRHPTKESRKAERVALRHAQRRHVQRVEPAAPVRGARED